MLKDESALAIRGVDTDENETSRVPIRKHKSLAGSTGIFNAGILILNRQEGERLVSRGPVSISKCISSQLKMIEDERAKKPF